MLTSHAILDKCRIFRLRQFQGQNYLIGRMSALAISASAAQAWLAFDGEHSLGEITQRMALRMDCRADDIERSLLELTGQLLAKGALKQVATVPVDMVSTDFTAEVVRLPAALLWGGFNS